MIDRRAFTAAELSHLTLIAEIRGISRETLIVRLIGVGLTALEAGCEECPAMPAGSFDAVLAEPTTPALILDSPLEPD